MQNVLLPGAAAVLALVFWLRRKPLKPMLSTTDTSGIAQLNRAQLERVLEPDPAAAFSHDPLEGWTPPQSEQERLLLQQRLRQAMVAGPEQRLLAVREAALWGHRSVLPLLRQALHDSDSAVVELAAEAIGRFRGSTQPAVRQSARPPRNVARMR